MSTQKSFSFVCLCLTFYFKNKNENHLMGGGGLRFNKFTPSLITFENIQSKIEFENSSHELHIDLNLRNKFKLININTVNFPIPSILKA